MQKTGDRRTLTAGPALHYWKAGPTLRAQRSHLVWAGLTGPAQADRPNRQPQPVIQADGSGQGGPTSTACLRLCLSLLTCSTTILPSPAPGRSGLRLGTAAGSSGESAIGTGAGGSANSPGATAPLPCSTSGPRGELEEDAVDEDEDEDR